MCVHLLLLLLPGCCQMQACFPQHSSAILPQHLPACRFPCTTTPRCTPAVFEWLTAPLLPPHQLLCGAAPCSHRNTQTHSEAYAMPQPVPHAGPFPSKESQEPYAEPLVSKEKKATGGIHAQQSALAWPAGTGLGCASHAASATACNCACEQGPVVHGGLPGRLAGQSCPQAMQSCIPYSWTRQNSGCAWPTVLSCMSKQCQHPGTPHAQQLHYQGRIEPNVVCGACAPHGLQATACFLGRGGTCGMGDCQG